MKSTLRFIFKFTALLVLSAVVFVMNIFTKDSEKGKDGFTQKGLSLSMPGTDIASADVTGGVPGGDDDCDGGGGDGGGDC